ncbi:MAG: hypothetical protein EB120_00325 [Proteobacteria bacterium]|nr:hypothetical protein [Pseudomonadota bacterium]
MTKMVFMGRFIPMKFSSNRDLKTEFVFFHGVFAVGLLFYFVRRYNGFDLELAVRAGSSLLTGQSPYDISANSPFRYAPWWCVLMLPIQWVSFRFIHWGFFGCTLLMLGRIQWILLEMTPQDSPLLCRKGPFRWALILPWILVLRGLGAQIEGGNTNVLLLYLSVEGAYQFFKNRSIGLLLMWAGVGVKPQFGLLLFYALVFCFDRKQLIYGLPLCVLAFGEWLLSFDVVGREVFNSIVVHYRLHTWCCVPLLVYFWQSAQKRGSDNQST